jgi:hypothetical protein
MAAKMIEVIIRIKDAVNTPALAKITIERVNDDPALGDYSVRFGVESTESVSLRQRALLAFPYRRYNVLALVLQALRTLEHDELLLLDGQESDYDRATEEVRRLRSKRFFR